MDIARFILPFSTFFWRNKLWNVLLRTIFKNQLVLGLCIFSFFTLVHSNLAYFISLYIFNEKEKLCDEPHHSKGLRSPLRTIMNGGCLSNSFLVFSLWIYFLSFARITPARKLPPGHRRKLNVHKTFRKRRGRLLKVLRTFNLRPVSWE